jgi:hypothetical protein
MFPFEPHATAPAQVQAPSPDRALAATAIDEEPRHPPISVDP